MNTIRTRIAVAAVFVGLGGLGGYAMATNPARDAQGIAQRVASTQAGPNAATTATRPVVTQTSGAPAPTATAVAATSPATRPVVTHTSGGGPGRFGDDGAEREGVYED